MKDIDRRSLLLLVQFTIREARRRYLGSVSGVVWVILQPLALLAIYSFVFSYVFRIRLVELSEIGFVSFVAVALWPWLAFQEALQRSTMAVEENAELLRKISVPNEILVIAAVLASFVIHGAGYLLILTVLWLVGKPLALGGLPFVLVVWVWLAVFALGLGLFLAALQVFLKDITQALSPVLMIWFYATPILYPLTLVPDSMRSLVEWNPMTYFSDTFRVFLLSETWRFNSTDVLALGGTISVLWLGSWFFRRCSTRFEEFL